jgi:hypothetical protein
MISTGELKAKLYVRMLCACLYEDLGIASIVLQQVTVTEEQRILDSIHENQRRRNDE